MFASSLRSRVAFGATKSASSVRYASTKTLKETLQEVIPAKQAQIKELRTTHASVKVGDVKIENIIGGMRGLKAMLWEGSVLDPNEGIRFHGLSIPDCQKVLPPAHGGKEIISESMLWLLLTGQVPSPEQVRDFSRSLAERGELPDHVTKLIPADLAPDDGIKKADYWEPVLEDSLDLVAKLPALAARIYRNTYKPETQLPAVDKNLDLVGNYVNMLGYGDNKSLTEYLRLYIALHGDHEGGNVSAHTSHLVGSALSDPYLSYSAALLGLAGPLHGLANQEVLRWMLEMQKAVGENPSHDQIKEYLWKTLKSGQVVPGYGHGVLRKPDPRFIALQQFSATRAELKDSPIIKLVNKTSEVAPGVLTEHGKAKSVHPNVDAVSGCLLYHYGLTEFKYYTVIFGVSRVLGCVSQLVWDRALGLPIERPKSVSMADLQKIVGSA
ncbi:citrate synthase [Rhizoctonia solani AG-1 IB]|uniref:Citrate synthase n=1 Tax=Thanatephorus cucumeris (strain AG1-IB / isolate 7/3/14) TaxID=1108050 RepID=A0A0B7F2S2_THACB|nr:citrate synthase [Rhizoctonia solani AG-1 IB]